MLDGEEWRLLEHWEAGTDIWSIHRIWLWQINAHQWAVQWYRHGSDRDRPQTELHSDQPRARAQVTHLRRKSSPLLQWRKTAWNRKPWL